MRAFPRRIAPLALLIVIGLFANGPSASGQEAVRVRPIERAPVVTTYPSTHIDMHPTIPLTPGIPLSTTIGNTPSCCGATTSGPEANSGAGGSGGDEGGGSADAAASPADNDALAESVVDTMMGELPVAAKQRGAE